MTVQDQSGAGASNPASGVSLDCNWPTGRGVRRLAFPGFPPPLRDRSPAGRSRFFRGGLAALGLALGLAAAAQAQAPVAKGNTDESKVGTYVLPDPLTLQSGAAVADAATWAKSRRG